MINKMTDEQYQKIETTLKEIKEDLPDSYDIETIKSDVDDIKDVVKDLKEQLDKIQLMIERLDR